VQGGREWEKLINKIIEQLARAVFLYNKIRRELV
jgi:hypothetical protein